ncbi:MAG TPA: ABC transporter ATP-binding protein [Chloroflexota bacterium]|nr:ABC transporter ATP-binding protein [Chloroflexota bacterium]
MIAGLSLSKTFGRFSALRDVDLDVGAGETVALLGANGAGKTTLLRILATLDKPSAGKLQIAGLDALGKPQRVRALIGLVAHQTYLHPELTAAEELRFYGRLYGLADLEWRVAEQLDRFGLTARAGSRIAALSRGQQQRLAIARALLHDPAVLLLDEPDTGLDTEGVAVLERLLAATGRTIVFSTHNHTWAKGLAARTLTLVNGRIG